MITHLGRVTILVADQDEALHFYTEKLGLEKRADMVFGPGARWVTVAPRGQMGIEIVLQQPNAGQHGEQGTREKLARIGQGTAWVFMTDDCRRTAAELLARGVHFLSAPEAQLYGIEATFEDLYGNVFSLLQPAKM